MFAQDHLYTGWYTATHRRLVEKHIEAVRAGTLHAPWKDEVWERDYGFDEYDNEDPEDEENIDNDVAPSADSRNGKGKQRARASGKAAKPWVERLRSTVFLTNCFCFSLQ